MLLYFSCTFVFCHFKQQKSEKTRLNQSERAVQLRLLNPEAKTSPGANITGASMAVEQGMNVCGQNRKAGHSSAVDTVANVYTTCVCRCQNCVEYSSSVVSLIYWFY